jgi:hypothetical protein
MLLTSIVDFHQHNLYGLHSRPFVIFIKNQNLVKRMGRQLTNFQNSLDCVGWDQNEKFFRLSLFIKRHLAVTYVPNKAVFRQNNPEIPSKLKNCKNKWFAFNFLLYSHY